MLWGSYGIVHIATLLLSAAIITGLYFLLKNRSDKTQTVVLFILSFSGISAIIFNLVTWGSPIEYLPFHMCSITAMLLPFAVITKNKVINNLLLLWCVGALIALVLNQAQANFEIFSRTFFFYYFPHTLEVGIPILMFALGLTEKKLYCIPSTLALTAGIYTCVHLINVYLNQYAVANTIVDWAGNVVKLNYMYSVDPTNPVLQLMYNLIPHPYWYMFVATPFIVLYLGIVYLPEIIRAIKNIKAKKSETGASI